MSDDLDKALEDVYRGHPRDEWQSLAHRLAEATRAEVARLQAKIERRDEAVGTLADEYDAAVDRVRDQDARAEDAEERLVAVKTILRAWGDAARAHPSLPTAGIVHVLAGAVWDKELREPLVPEQDEPEYEYGFRDEHNVPYPVRFDSQMEAQDWLDFSKRKAEDFRMMRRRKAGPWEDVK